GIVEELVHPLLQVRGAVVFDQLEQASGAQPLSRGLGIEIAAAFGRRSYVPKDQSQRLPVEDAAPVKLDRRDDYALLDQLGGNRPRPGRHPRRCRGGGPEWQRSQSGASALVRQ